LKASLVLLKEEENEELACDFSGVSGRTWRLRFLLIDINGSLKLI
jgi:hypothetical protein